MTAPAEPPRNRLADLPPDACWWRYTWVDFADWKDRERTLVVVPVHGFADWGLGPGAGLDVEERLGTALLGAAWEEFSLAGAPLPRLLIAPPQRFVLGPSRDAFFALPYALALRVLREPLESIREAGFARVVFFSTSPWNADLVDTVARDARIELGLQMFCIGLAGLGLDPAAGEGSVDRARWRRWLVGGEAAAALEREAGGYLARLLREVANRQPLADGGKLRAADPAPWRGGARADAKRADA